MVFFFFSRVFFETILIICPKNSLGLVHLLPWVFSLEVNGFVD